ncbi:MAG: ABC transporter substrate-binding protein [Saprospiraceae bacterium]
MRFIGWCFCSLLLSLAGCADPAPETDLSVPSTWAAIENAARGQTVDWMMWSGDPFINDYVQGYVVPTVKDRYGITLNVISGQGSAIVQVLMTEMEAGRTDSELDMMWINGETFFQLRQIDALYGDWTRDIPNAEYIDFDNPFIGRDFQQPIEGYELPWGNVQMALIYNSETVTTPPQTRDELAAFVRQNPGRFTFDVQFTGLTFLKALLIDIAGGQNALNGDFDETRYKEYSTKLWAYINSLKPYLWKEGRTFPEDVAQMHQMFANGEIWFTMSNNDSEVDNKITQGLFPTTARSYVPAFGTIQNSHYLGIVNRSDAKPAAMVTANFLISPEAQLRKADPAVWGDGSVLSLDKLPDSLRTRFTDLPSRKYSPARADIQERARLELAPEYMIRLAEDFRKYVINR